MTINKIKLNTNTIEDHILQKKIFFAVAGALAVCSMLYLYLVGKIIFNVVGRNTAASEMRALSSNIGDLETRYMSLAKNIDLNLANSLGFSETKNTFFASRKSSVGFSARSSDEL